MGGCVGWGGVAAEGGASPTSQRQGAIEKLQKTIVINYTISRKSSVHNNPHHVRDRCICSYFANNLLNTHDINTRGQTIIKVKD